jgi:hypothetical protein
MQARHSVAPKSLNRRKKRGGKFAVKRRKKRIAPRKRNSYNPAKKVKAEALRRVAANLRTVAGADKGKPRLPHKSRGKAPEGRRHKSLVPLNAQNAA